MRMKIKRLDQVISDEEFVSLKNYYSPEILVFRFLIRQGRRTIKDVERMYKTKEFMEPLWEEYIRYKEALLGKSRILFTEKEKQETMKGMDDIYEKLREKGIVY